LGICCISPSFTVNAGIIRISFLYFYAYKNMPHLCRIYPSIIMYAGICRLYSISCIIIYSGICSISLLYYYSCRNMPHISHLPQLAIMLDPAREDDIQVKSR
jgi:hypothetical protein